MFWGRKQIYKYLQKHSKNENKKNVEIPVKYGSHEIELIIPL